MEHTMTAVQAQTFDRKSLASEMLLANAAEERGCQCQPYVDWFTYNRWQAQGMQVQRATEVGHGIKLTTWVQTKDKDGEPGRTFPKRTTVFCRCQTKPKEARHA